MPTLRQLNDKQAQLVSALQLDEGLQPPNHPQAFRPEPLVNDPQVQRILHEILNAAPQIGHRLGQIVVGPTEDTLNELAGTKFNTNDYDRLNLLGTTNTKSKNISLNPRLVLPGNQDKLLETLVHELAHASINAEESEAQVFGAAMRKLK